MRINMPLLDKLAKATPRKNILQWVVMTLLYGFAIIVNDHFDLVQALGLPERPEAVVRLCGVYLYIFLTAYSFQKTKDDEIHTDHNQIAAAVADDHKPDGNTPAPGTQSHAPGNRAHEPQSEPAQRGPASGDAFQWKDSQPDGCTGTPAKGTP